MSSGINIANPTSFKAHRSGWRYAISSMMKYHDPSGILLDDFIDITFGYNYEQNKIDKKIPYKKPWLGFLHHPPNICPWYEDSYKQKIDINIFLRSEEFEVSAKYCKCLFVLSDYLASFLKKNIKCLKHVPIVSIKHPTEPAPYLWDFKKFKQLYNVTGMKIVNIGYFLRHLSSIYTLKNYKKLDKIILPSSLNLALENLEREIIYKNLSQSIDLQSVKIIDWQENNFYDKVLEQSLVFLDLYDTSCNNAIIESIVRNCPIIVNKHPAVIEYLGQDYPLYFDDLSDISNLTNYDLIASCSDYLSKLNHKELAGEYFSETVYSSLKQYDILIQKIKSKNTIFNPKSYNLLSKSANFDHRFGWPWVMEYISNSLNTNKKSNNLYINDFAEHIFRLDTNNQTKDILIENKIYKGIRGYNLFAYQNSDLIEINDKHYIWNNIKSEWTTYPVSEVSLYNLDFAKISTYKNNPWIAFFHNPPTCPKWFDYGQNINNIISNNIDFLQSLQNCKKIFVLSQHLKDHIKHLLHKYNLSIPIVVLKHPIPTSIPDDQLFDYNKFLTNPKIIQLGYWMRKMHTIWQVKTPFKKMWLYGHKFAIDMLEAEKNNIKDYKDLLSHNDIQKIKYAILNGKNITINSVEVLKVSNDEYDNLLGSSVALANLYDSSANNSVIECICRMTPILVNRLSAIEEYLGQEYPLYIDDYKDINSILKDTSRILDAHLYLKDNIRLRMDLNIDEFIAQFNKETQKL
jgi:hypothetical protein